MVEEKEESIIEEVEEEPEPELESLTGPLPYYVTGVLEYGDLTIPSNEQFYIGREQSFVEAMNNKLSQLRFKKVDDVLTAVQFIFETGVASPLFESAGMEDVDADIASFNIDRVMRRISILEGESGTIRRLKVVYYTSDFERVSKDDEDEGEWRTHEIPVG